MALSEPLFKSLPVNDQGLRSPSDHELPASTWQQYEKSTKAMKKNPIISQEIKEQEELFLRLQALPLHPLSQQQATAFAPSIAAASHVHDRSMAAPGHHHAEVGLDQQGWETGCPAALPHSRSHCHTTGPPWPRQELSQLLGHGSIAGLHR